MRDTIKTLELATTAYSEYFFSTKNIVLKALPLPFVFANYFLSPEKMSKRFNELFLLGRFDLTNSFLTLTETKLYALYQMITEPRLEVDELLYITPDPLQLRSENNNKTIDIPIPRSHIGVKPIACRLFSARRREGMVRD